MSIKEAQREAPSESAYVSASRVRRRPAAAAAAAAAAFRFRHRGRSKIRRRKKRRPLLPFAFRPPFEPFPISTNPPLAPLFLQHSPPTTRKKWHKRRSEKNDMRLSAMRLSATSVQPYNFNHESPEASKMTFQECAMFFSVIHMKGAMTMGWNKLKLTSLTPFSMLFCPTLAFLSGHTYAKISVGQARTLRGGAPSQSRCRLGLPPAPWRRSHPTGKSAVAALGEE